MSTPSVLAHSSRIDEFTHAQANPTQIIAHLGEKFFSPCAVITDSFEVIAPVPAIKDKSRASLEKFKCAINEYINKYNTQLGHCQPKGHIALNCQYQILFRVAVSRNASSQLII